MNKKIGKQIYTFAKEIFPIHRSITGKGLRETLNKIKKINPSLQLKSLPSNQKVFDWKIPDEWNIKDAYVKDKYKKKIIDFKKNNLHLLGYSQPINKKITKKELYKNIFFLKGQPGAIPYITSYFVEP